MSRTKDRAATKGKGRTRQNISSLDSASRASTTSLPTLSKKLGQNFLVDMRVVGRIIDAIQPQPNETIIEIGPGGGALTESLLDRAGRVVAIEFDRKLIPILQKRFEAQQNFTLIQSDALITDFCEVIKPTLSARVVANLPYNVATPILQKLIEQRRCIPEMTLMLQREVVERITAPPATSERGYLSVLVEAYCKSEKLFDVAPSCFKPAPKVWSSVVQLTIRPRVAAEVKDEKVLWQVVSAGFAQRRKTILNNLRSAPEPLQENVKLHGGASIGLCVAEVDVQRRAETLTFEEWARIANALS